MSCYAEEKLIFTCLKNNGDARARSDALNPPASDIDWGAVIRLSMRHGIAPLLYIGMHRLLPKSHMPDDKYRILKNAYYGSLYSNIVRWHEFSSISDVARDFNIMIIPFKGSILSRTIYKDPALRTFTDIDMLIKEKDLPGMKKLLLEKGYKETEEKDNYLFTKKLTRQLHSSLEVHTNLVPPRPHPIHVPDLWERARGCVIEGRRINCLSKEDTLISLALHLRRHTRFLILRSIYDIGELLKLYKDAMDWEYIEGIAEGNRIKNCIYFCIYICAELLGICISYETIKRFSPGMLKKKMIRLCINKRNFLRPPIWQGYVLRVLMFDRVADIFLYFLNFLRRGRARKCK